MPLLIQAKFLRVIETGEVSQLGSEVRKQSNFRLVAATNRNLWEPGKCRGPGLRPSGSGWNDRQGDRRHFGLTPKLGRYMAENKYLAYNYPLGVMAGLFRAAIQQRPGELTEVGLKTFVDPRLEGVRINAVTTEDLVKVVEFEGDEWLWYLTPKFDVAIIRGTAEDKDGNITVEHEATKLEMRTIAMGVKACGGALGAGQNAMGILDMRTMFDFYDGGGLNMAVLGLAEANAKGDINVGRFGPKTSGCRGFINISQNTGRVVFCDAFTSG